MSDTPIDDDELDGCELDFAADPTTDDDAPYLALFAGVDPSDVEAHAAELRQLLPEANA